MTPAEIKASPLKRGDFLLHPALGVVVYARKIRGNPDSIIVTHTGGGFTGAKSTDVRVNVADLSRHKRGRGRQGSKLILAACPDCNLKIRVTRVWLETGTPRCFNLECPGMIYGVVNDARVPIGKLLEVDYGTDGEGTQQADMRAVGKTMQAEHYGRDVDFSTLDDEREKGK